MEDRNVIKIRARFVMQKYPKTEFSEENSWGVVRWQVCEVVSGTLDLQENSFDSSPIVVNGNDSIITITGEYGMPLSQEKMYNIIAEESDNIKYGKQYNLIYFSEDIDLKKINNQKDFLKEILTDKQIKELFKVHDNPLSLIVDHNTEELLKVKGLGPILIQKLYKRYEEKKDLSAIYLQLNGIGLSPILIRKLLNTYGSPDRVVEIIKNNPYKLTYDIDGIGFIKADEIALSNGISPKSPDRIMAYINFYLEDQASKGHSYITAGELLANIYNAFGGRNNIEEPYYDDKGNLIGNNIALAVKNMREKNELVVEEGENKARRRVYLTKYFDLEYKISSNLKRLLDSPNHFNYAGWEEKVRNLEKKQGFEFTDEQKQGIYLGLRSQVCYITGLAGSGKSTLVAGILAALKGYSFAQTALSGRAAAQLQEITGESGQTIHRLLSFQPGEGFFYNKSNPLPYDIIILDELSLVGGEIFLRLIEAIKDGAKLICLGDSGQLESIGVLNLANDIMKSNEIPTVILKKVHRQALKSGILTTAYSVRAQEQLYEDYDYEGVEVRGELKDMIVDVQKEKEGITEKVLNYFDKYYNSPLVKRNVMDIQVLVPVKNRGENCVNKLNKAIQQIVNPINENSFVPKYFVKKNKKNIEDNENFWIQVGDKVMCIKNNYSILDIYGGKCSIFNGWLGIVEDITDDKIIVDFVLGDNPVMIDKNDVINELILGYASTIHKCQGSGFKVVIGALDFSTPPSMLTCQLLYTLFTRAKVLCVFCGQTAALRKAISSNYVSTKRTFLVELLKNMYQSKNKDEKRKRE